MSKNLDKIILIGGFSEMIELCLEEKIEICAIIDSVKEFKVGERKYFPLGNDDYLIRNYQKIECKNLLLTPDNPAIRKKLKIKFNSLFNFPKILSKYALISSSATIGKGVVIQKLAHISSNVQIHDFVKINSCANIMHDSVIGKYSTVAPNAVILGRVSIKENVYIGANSTILPNISIGANSIIGAGAVITKDVPPNVVVAGVPGRILK